MTVHSPAAVLLAVATGALVLAVCCDVAVAEIPEYDLNFNITKGEGTVKVFVSPDELETMMESEKGVTLLDAREAPGPLAVLANRRTESIPGSYHAHWTDFIVEGTRDTLQSVEELEGLFRERGVSNDVPVVVYGVWTEGWGEEGRIFWQLHWLGHQQAYILYGGVFAWNTSDHEGRGRTADGDFVAKPIDDRIIDADQLKKRLDTEPQNLVVLDARTIAEYEGAQLYGEERGGHVPGAVQFEWKRVFAEDGSGNLKNSSKLKEELMEIGVADDVAIVTYCTGGIRSSFLYSVLTWLGYEDVTNYAASWWDWASREDLPISD
ncbi:unnamed protein product [Ostreobium quekettii]|uniref:Rhodanese domain-containing protein n=1 Tax=Ostreobium quekettii TaxID=121088 RepID=A0A8S1IZP7_9CHLO|nr:unnamed protein product [Ostreobium quekettii]|eukprot:evm.model.scf_778.1 EVM.evm.TU.scf_778.1   scf_778:5894-8967(-)